MKMACDLLQFAQSVNFASSIVSLEHFKGQKLQDAVACSQKVASLELLKKDDVSARFSVTDKEARRLGEATNSVVELLQEMKRAISRVKEMKQRVRNRKDNNINVTREMFTTLRKAMDEREEQMITDIKEGAYRRERALEVILCFSRGVRHQLESRTLRLESQMESRILPWNLESCPSNKFN